MKVLIIPKGVNPYQELIYSNLRKSHTNDKFTYLVESRVKYLFYPLIFLAKRLQGYNVIHYHWNVFVISHKLPLARIFSYYYTLVCLSIPKLLGYKVIWTVHELTTQESWTFDDIGLSRRISKMVDAKIIHSSYTLDEMHNAKLSIEKTYLVPHGNYIGVYKNNINKVQARKKLRIPDREFVILFFGTVRFYKGMDSLLDVFCRMRHKNIRLVIAGKCNEPELIEMITKAQKEHNIDFYNKHIQDHDVAKYFQACNVVCLPFNKITTSGSAILAMSFAKPIVAPLLGALQDFPSSVGFLYPKERKNGLKHSLEKSVMERSKLSAMGRQGLEYVKPFSWDKIAEQTYAIYTAALGLNIDGSENKLPLAKISK
jgi:beta-1,4-mannosyltransferase